MSWARTYHKHYSKALHRDMEALVFGHAGAPVLVFPTSRGRFHQWEDFRMLESLGPSLNQGWLQLYCIDGIDNETWYDFDKPQSEILKLHLAYDQYVSQEVLPWISSWNRNPFLMVTGTSFGAYQAANFAFRHPERIRRLLAMSGDYCIRKYLDDYDDLGVYFQNPVDYLPNVRDPELLKAMARIDIILASGLPDFCLEPTRRLSAILSQIGVGHRCEVWGKEAIHDWPTWRAMVATYL